MFIYTKNREEYCKTKMIKSKRKIEKNQIALLLTKAVCKGRRHKSPGGEACKPNVNGPIFLATSFKYYFFILPRLFLSLPLRLSLFSDTKQATQNCHHHTKSRSATTTRTSHPKLKLPPHHHYYFT